MEGRLYFGVLLAIILAVRGQNTETGINDCGLVGMWKNELNSQMQIKRCTNGEISGRYNSRVGDAKSWYPLVGRYTITKSKVDDQTKAIELGWTVSWNNKANGNSNSVTTWSGIYYPDPPKIHTQWILTSYVQQEDLWKSAMINHDTFHREKQA